MAAGTREERDGREEALRETARRGHANLARALLRRGEVDADCGRNSVMRPAARLAASPVALAARSGATGVLLALLEHGAVLKQTDATGMGALHHAAKNGHADAVAKLVAKGADVKTVDAKGRTALMLASWFGHRRVCKLLLSGPSRHPTVLNRGDAASGRTALHGASARGNCAAVHLLLRSGADVDAADAAGRSALFLASSADVAEALLAAGAALDLADEQGRTSLDVAATGDDVRVLQALLAELQHHPQLLRELVPAAVESAKRGQGPSGPKAVSLLRGTAFTRYSYCQ